MRIAPTLMMMSISILESYHVLRLEGGVPLLVSEAGDMKILLATISSASE
jgi:hypothetical protein